MRYMQPQNCALDETRTARDSGITETLPLPGIILGIGVREPPRPNRLDLNNRLAPSPHKMAGSLRDDDEAFPRPGLCGLYLALVAAAAVGGARRFGLMLLRRAARWAARTRVPYAYAPL